LRRYGLIGRKLRHSLSQELFEAQGFKDASYGLYEMSSLDGLRHWVEDEHICGFNVTIPYKQAILPLLDTVNDMAAEIGAVNCVSVKDGRLTGHNTDAPAFMATMAGEHCHSKALILGTGGAARAVAYALRQLGIEYVFASRHPDAATVKPVIGYDKITVEYGLIVNATPVGMYPDTESTPLPLSTLQSPLSNLTVYDLIYNPSHTLLMREAETFGARVKNGLDMLHRQAELSWAIWGL
jgi:shikimate dehydrogenase